MRDVFYDNPVKDRKFRNKNGPKNPKKNALECQRHCARREGCRFWSYERKNAWCFHHAGERKEYKNPKLKKDLWLSGDKDCVPEDIPDNAEIKGSRGRRGYCRGRI